MSPPSGSSCAGKAAASPGSPGPPGSAQAPGSGSILETLRRFQQEAIRGRRILKRFRLLTIPPGLAAAAVLYLKSPREDRWAVPLAVVVLGYWGADAFIFRGWRLRFKREIISPLASGIREGLRYDPEGVIPRLVFEDSGLFTRSPDSYRGEDLVAGALGEGEVQCCEIDAARCRKRLFFRLFPRLALKLATQDDLERIFKGIFVLSDFNKTFQGTTLLLPEAIGAPGEDLQGFRKRGSAPLEPVELEDPEFERLFKVYSSDQVEARYLLSTSFMQRLMEYRRRSKLLFAASFHASRLTLAFPGNSRRLEPPPPALFLRDYGDEISAGRSPWELGDYLQELRFGIELAEELKLNTRIWSRA
jgi:uncharacterized protein DUF3137